MKTLLFGLFFMLSALIFSEELTIDTFEKVKNMVTEDQSNIFDLKLELALKNIDLIEKEAEILRLTKEKNTILIISAVCAVIGISTYFLDCYLKE